MGAWRNSLKRPCVFLCSRYVHDDSETSEDSTVLRVTDGHNNASVRLSIQVIPQ